MIPKSCRLFGQDHAAQQDLRDQDRFNLKRSWSRAFSGEVDPVHRRKCVEQRRELTPRRWKRLQRSHDADAAMHRMAFRCRLTYELWPWLATIPVTHPAPPGSEPVGGAMPDRIMSKRGLPKRIRKLIGTVAILAIVIVYAFVAMALAESRIVDAPKAVQVLAYAMLGLLWILPCMPVIRWMERPEPEQV